MKIAYIGAGSLCFGPAIVKDLLISELIGGQNLEIALMDILPDNLIHVKEKSEKFRQRYGRKANIWTTTSLEDAVRGADFVICAIEVERYFYWAQDFHIPRKYGIKQIYGENGGPGSCFHAMRNIPPIIHIARTMEKLCPDAWLLNFSNPEHKLCEAVSRLTNIKTVGLCHGVNYGSAQIARLLDKPLEELELLACGINHFTWFQRVADKKSGFDLYPKLKESEAKGHPLSSWHELALGRVLFNHFGLWPSPGTNHYGEYISWAYEFMGSDMHFYYDPVKGHPWETGKTPEFVYTADMVNTHRPWESENHDSNEDYFKKVEQSNDPSGEYAADIIEGIYYGINKFIPAINIVNNGKIPNLPSDMVVELPAVIRNKTMEPVQMESLPEPVAALCRTQGSINKLLVESFAEGSKQKLLQALLLDPVVNSYRQCVQMMNELLDLQKNILPEFK